MKITDDQLPLIDLFCGAGGAALGFQQAGFEVKLGVDNNTSSLSTFSRNLRAKTEEFDLFRVGGQRIMESAELYRGELTLLLGCPPCQGFSALGDMREDDERNQLVHKFVNIVLTTKPLFFAFENVPGLEEQDQYYGRMLRKLIIGGYGIERQVVDMRDYGVPQRRKRLVTVGCSDRKLMKRFIFPIPTYGSELGNGRWRRWETVRNAIEDLPRIGAGCKSKIPNHGAGVHTALIMERIKKIPKNGGSWTSLPDDLKYECHRKENAGFKDIMGRMHWDEPSPTITTGCCNPTKGRYLHPRQNREISVREAARLQTFPDDFIFPDSKTDACRQIGNALPPFFARKIGERIAIVLA